MDDMLLGLIQGVDVIVWKTGQGSHNGLEMDSSSFNRTVRILIKQKNKFKM